MQFVGDHRTLQCCVIHLCASLQTGLQVFAGLTAPRGHFHQGQHLSSLSFCIQHVTEPVHCIHKDVDTLVLEFVASRCGHYEGVVGKSASREGVCHTEDARSGLLAHFLEVCGGRHEVSLKTVHQHLVARAVKQFRTFLCRHVRHGGEAIHVVCSLSLDGVLGSHIQFVRHLRAVVCPQIVVERLAVAGYGAAYGSGVSGEYRSYFRHVLSQIERTQTGHPFMGLIHHVFRFLQVVAVEALYHACCRIRKHGSLVIVSIGIQGVHLEVHPRCSVEFIFYVKERLEVNKDNTRISRNVPPACPHLEAFFPSLGSPLLEELLLLVEKRVLLVLPEVRTDEYQLVLHFLL